MYFSKSVKHLAEALSITKPTYNSSEDWDGKKVCIVFRYAPLLAFTSSVLEQMSRDFGTKEFSVIAQPDTSWADDGVVSASLVLTLLHVTFPSHG